jgi:type IV pilus assembly protein PilE
MTKRLTGFSLIELMIAVVVVSILAAIAVPTYQNQVSKSRRTDAQGALSGFANAMERFYTANNSYLGAAGTNDVPANSGAPRIFATESPMDGATKYYDLTIKNDVTASRYTLVATPKGGQASDGVLELDSTGARRWDRNNNGAFGADENCWSQSCD